MQQAINGIHHITAIASDAQPNLDFYTQVLGLRLVKLTVNFDAPDTYHFYFADGAGHPGTLLTFFIWPGTRRGTRGTGQADTLGFSIPSGSMGYWVDRLKSHALTVSTPFRRFDDEVIAFQDPDGLQIELVAGQVEPEPGASPWQDGPVPAAMELRGFHGVTLFEAGMEASAGLLEDTYGFRLTRQSAERLRFEAPSSQPGRTVDLISGSHAPFGRMGVGIIHHVAWRAANDAQQLAWRETLVAKGFDVTPVIDRRYFHSIYFREPGGVLFEIATDPPGFTVDEDIDCLGASLRLPPWLEGRRDEISRALPELKLPAVCPEPA